MKRFFIVFFFSIIMLAASGLCITFTKSNLITEKSIRLSGAVALEEGQFVRGHHFTKRQDTILNYTIAHFEPFRYPVWIHRAYARIQVDAYIQERLHIVLSPEVKLWYESYPFEDVEAPPAAYPFREHAYVAIADGEGIYSFGDIEKPFLQVAAGVMPFKYNPDASNLGEYLFRTGCYPPYIISGFDFPFVRLSGLRLSSTLFGSLRQDILLTTETQIQPLFDWSLSYLAGYSISSVIEIGAGVNFNRLFPISENVTRQKWPQNGYLTSTGDSAYFGFSGTKVMGRISFNPHGVLPQRIARIFGKEDGKIFAEAAILGTTSYTTYKYRDPRNGDSTIILDSLRNYYCNLKDRIPVMFGLNIPTFKLFDIVSVQGEWYGWPYTDALYYQTKAGQNATPIPVYLNYSRDDYKKDNWKWSVYFKKTLLQQISLIGQIARDHSHHDSYYEILKDDNEVFTRPNEWGWWLKLQYTF